MHSAVTSRRNTDIGSKYKNMPALFWLAVQCTVSRETMLLWIFFLYSSVWTVNGYAVVYAPPTGYYCYLKCLNRCLATPPKVKVKDALELCKTEVCWPMTDDDSYCDPNSRTCFTGSCKPNDVGWLIEKTTESIKMPNVTSKRRHGDTTLWRIQWDPVPGAIFYALYYWKEGGETSRFYHQEIRETWYQFPIKHCQQQLARVAAISTTGMSPFSDTTKVYPVWNGPEEVVLNITMKSLDLVPLPYHDSSEDSTVENSTLVLTFGYQVESPGWKNYDVLGVVDYTFSPMSCHGSPIWKQSNLKTDSGRNEFVLNLPGSMANGICKFLFLVKSITAPCSRTVPVIHSDSDKNGLRETIDCAQIENAVCMDDGLSPSSSSPVQITMNKEETRPAGPHFFPYVHWKKLADFSNDGAAVYVVMLVTVLFTIPAVLFCLFRFVLRQKE